MTAPEFLALPVHCAVVRPEWIDFNGHMNVAYYLMAFDQAADGLIEALGLGPDYRARTACSTFVVEAHITYQRELHEGDPFEIRGRLIDFDEKRMRVIQLMSHETAGHRVASVEWLMIHVDTKTRRAVPLPADILADLARRKAAVAEEPMPAEVGRSIGLGKRPGAA
jgi:acyl-CoA thioester hydrolase